MFKNWPVICIYKTIACEMTLKAHVLVIPLDSQLNSTVEFTDELSSSYTFKVTVAEKFGTCYDLPSGTVITNL